MEEILNLTEGNLATVSCLTPGAPTCHRMAECRTYNMWKGLDEMISDYFSKITLTRKEGADNSVRLLTGVQFPMTLTDSGNGHKVTVDADETFTNGVLWQQDAESFVCMEPWNGWANSVNEEGKHEVLEPDEAMTSEWSITIEKV